jgi:NTP pyrophosphatase (non-canonical NTP hydrolase)
MRDRALVEKSIFEMIKTENCRQIRKWGVQDRTPFEWLAILTEEVGELSRAIIEYAFSGGIQGSIVQEAIQVATRAAKIAEMSLYLDPGNEKKR